MCLYQAGEAIKCDDITQGTSLQEGISAYFLLIDFSHFL